MTVGKLLTSIAIVLSIGIDGSPVVVEAGCFSNDEVLHRDVLRYLKAKVNQTSMSEVYEVIDSKLRSSVRNDKLDKNMRVVMRLLHTEIKAKIFGPEKRYCFGFGTLPLMSEDFDKNITINALLRLYDLEKIEKNGLGCTIPYTHYLVENNLLAKDPIGRRLRNEPNLLPRIDNLIFDIARKRAEHCLPKYKELLTEILGLYCYGMVKNYWDPIFKHRLVKDNFKGDREVDSVFRDSPSEALEFFDSTENAIEEDQMVIILDRLSKAKLTSSFKIPYDGTDENIHRFEKFVRTPCSNYIDATSDLLESLEFSMKLRPYLPKEVVSMIDNDQNVYRLRAYYSMCKKLVKEKDRFVQLLNLLLINSLPYQSDEY